MGTASTMASLAEALGSPCPALPRSPAADARHQRLAEQAGRLAVDLAKSGLRPREFISPGRSTNAMTVLQALGGSTNAVVHLAAIAGRAGLDWDLDELDAVATAHAVAHEPRSRPASYLMEDFFDAGGVPALLRVAGPPRPLGASVLGDPWARWSAHRDAPRPT